MKAVCNLRIHFRFLGWSLLKGVAEEAVFRGMAVRELTVKWGFFLSFLFLSFFAY